MSLYSLLHNPDYLPQLFAFRPERWLGPEDETWTSIRLAFVPFALGDRGCAGKAMGYLESSLTVAKKFWYFDFETAPVGLGRVGGGRRMVGKMWMSISCMIFLLLIMKDRIWYSDREGTFGRSWKREMRDLNQKRNLTIEAWH